MHYIIYLFIFLCKNLIFFKTFTKFIFLGWILAYMLVPERAQSGLILEKKIINRFKCELDFYPELDFLNFGVKKLKFGFDIYETYLKK